MLSFSGQIRTKLGIVGYTTGKIRNHHIFDDKSIKFQGKTIEELLVNIEDATRNLYKIYTLGATYSRLFRENKLQTDDNFSPTFTLSILPNVNDDVLMIEWKEISPLTMLNAVSTKWLFYINAICNKAELILDNKMDDPLSNIFAHLSFYDLIKMIRDEFKLVQRIAQTSLAYRKHFFPDENE